SVILLAATALGRIAEAPASLKSERRATLIIRSQLWRELALNHRAIGFAPLEIHDIPPGRHLLSWKSSQGVGEISLDLRPRELRQISDNDWNGRGAGGKH